MRSTVDDTARATMRLPRRAQWEEAWGDEIDRRLEEYRAGKARKDNVADVIAALRARR